MATKKPKSREVDVRILLIGDRGVGKTSLINSLIEDRFIENVPRRLKGIILHPDSTPENILTVISDYNEEEQTKEQLVNEIKKASVIVIVYQIHDEKAIEKVRSHWMPLVQEALGGTMHGRPVIIVGNKSDDHDSNSDLDKVLHLMNEFSEIETCVESSAKTMKNISDIFYYAQRAVIYPSLPIYYPEDRDITPSCRRALVRIFKLCDNDNDALLNQYELNQFQLFCFGIPLAPNSFSEILTRVEELEPKGLMSGSLTLDGFIALQMIFINRGRYEIVWNVLRKFGYSNDLTLREDYLYPAFKLPLGSSTELSCEGYQFIAQLFEKFDEDKDCFLNPSELQNALSLCPLQQQWIKQAMYSVETDVRGWVTYNGFISLWTMNTFLNVSQTMENLAYLGFNVKHVCQLEALVITRDRRVDIEEKETQRNIFQCHVFGPKDAGKTAFIHSITNKSMQRSASMTKQSGSSHVTNLVKVKDECKYLLLHEVDIYSQDELLTTYEKNADVVVLLYDVSNPSSFAYSANIYLKHFNRTKVPCLFIATKIERYEVDQDYEMQPNEFCRFHELPEPYRFRNTEVGKSSGKVFQQLVTMAMYPHLKKVYYLNDNNLFSKLSVGAAIAALAGFLLYKNI
uniref:Mitochondrial Rho GTPase n=1 Tax=Rhabditophanes sp. KR3021 TaxID=114890 RepID=A0AC35U6Z5_9BILA